MTAVDESKVDGELLSLAVHEFRTPVTVVAGYLRMLSRDQAGPLSEKQRKLVAEAEKSCARLSSLVAEMSDLAQLESDPPAPVATGVPLAELLDQALAEVQEGRDRQVVAGRTGDANGIVIAGDRKRLLKVFAALLTAVLREQTDAGQVDVHVAGSERERAVYVGIGRAPEAAQVIGAGRTEARLNEYRGCLGLALPIARRVIEHAGGRVWSTASGRAIGAIGICLPFQEKHS